MFIRAEHSNDYEAIREVILAAFADQRYSRHNEQDIVDALRVANALTVSLVAVEDDEVVGHIACSPVLIDGKADNWFGLGPVAVRPDTQGKGIGATLVRASIAQLGNHGANGIVLLGEPEYYTRFGFTARTELTLHGAPPSYFLCLPLRDAIPKGAVIYHSAFAIS